MGHFLERLRKKPEEPEEVPINALGAIILRAAQKSVGISHEDDIEELILKAAEEFKHSPRDIAFAIGIGSLLISGRSKKIEDLHLASRMANQSRGILLTLNGHSSVKELRALSSATGQDVDVRLQLGYMSRLYLDPWGTHDGNTLTEGDNIPVIPAHALPKPEETVVLTDQNIPDEDLEDTWRPGQVPVPNWNERDWPAQSSA